MGTFFKYLIGVLLALTAVIIGILYFSFQSIIVSGIEQNGSEMTGTPVTVSAVTINPLSGRGTIRGLTIANPDGYTQELAVEVDEIAISIDVWSLFSDHVLVRSLIVRSPSIMVEQQLPNNNLREILRHIQNLEFGETSNRQLTIEQFLLVDGRVGLLTEVGSDRQAEVEISRIELEGIGTGSNASAEHVIQIIAEAIGEEALEGALQRGGQQIRDAIRNLFN
ncbi:MAG: hypothetical protein ACNA78_07535 [Balneolaceae bacterium]